MTGLEAIALGLTAASAVVGAGAAVYGGIKANEAAEIEGKALERAGKDEFAAAQREALEARLQGRLVQSRQQAVAAASGGGAGLDAPSIVKLMSETGERTDYAAAVAMAQGRMRQSHYNQSAESVRRGGQASLVGSFLSAAGTLAGGLGKFGTSYAELYP
jgi:hypothetical protein